MAIVSNVLSVIRGDDEDLDLEFKDADDVAIDITGWTVFFTVKLISDDGTDDTNALIQKDQTSHTDPTNGLTTISLSTSDTDITPGQYNFDIQALMLSGNITSWNKGTFQVEKDITKRIA